MPAALQRYVAELHGANDDAGALQLARGLVRRIVGIALGVTLVGAVGVVLLRGGSRIALAFLAVGVSAQPMPVFTDVALETGFQDRLAHGRALVSDDFNGDGWNDFFLGNPGDAALPVAAV